MVYDLLAATPLEASSGTLNVFFNNTIPIYVAFKFLRYLAMLRRSLYT